MNNDLENAINNFDHVVEYLISNPQDEINIQELMRDYNILRQELSKLLVDK